MKTDHDGFLQFPTVKLELSREEAKLLRRILACSTWDIVNLSDDEKKLLIEINNGLIDYLVHSDHDTYKEKYGKPNPWWQDTTIQCGEVRTK